MEVGKAPPDLMKLHMAACVHSSVTGSISNRVKPYLGRMILDLCTNTSRPHTHTEAVSCLFSERFKDPGLAVLSHRTDVVRDAVSGAENKSLYRRSHGRTKIKKRERERETEEMSERHNNKSGLYAQREDSQTIGATTGEIFLNRMERRMLFLLLCS